MKKLAIFLALFILILTGCNSANIPERSTASSDDNSVAADQTIYPETETFPDIRIINFDTEEGKAIKERLENFLARTTEDNPDNTISKVGNKTILEEKDSVFLLSDDGKKVELLAKKPFYYHFIHSIDDNRFVYGYNYIGGHAMTDFSGFGIYDIAEMKDHQIEWDKGSSWFLGYSGLDKPYPLGEYFMWHKIDEAIHSDKVHVVNLSTYEKTVCTLKRTSAPYTESATSGKYLIEVSENGHVDFESNSHSTVCISDITTGEYISFTMPDDGDQLRAIFVESNKFYLYTHPEYAKNFTHCYEITFKL